MTPDTPEDLKPCPFCGAALAHDPQIVPVENWFAHPKNHCLLSDFAIEADDVERWNLRSNETPDDWVKNIQWVIRNANPEDQGWLDEASKVLDTIKAMSTRPREKELETALRNWVDACPDCDGTGTTHTMEDETEIGQPPGSSGIRCPRCDPSRALLQRIDEGETG